MSDEPDCTIQDLYNLISSPELRSVENRVKRFNPLTVLGVEDAEIRHSNVLSWLLTPTELHGFGDAILRKFMAEVIVENENVPDDFILTDIYFQDFSDAEVRREWNHIDVLVISRQRKTLLLIENKIWSSESADQLRRYLDLCHRSFPGYQIMPVYLTLEGDEPRGDDRYCWFSHRRLAQMVENELEGVKDVVSDQVVDFINYYVATIRRALGMDEQLEALCRNIYNKHKSAIDAIMAVVDKSGFALREATDDFFAQHSHLRLTWFSQKQSWFVDTQWEELKDKVSSGWNEGYPVAMWFSEYYGLLKLVLEVGPIEPADRRLRFLEHLEDYDFKIRQRAKSPDRKFTRVYTNTMEVNDWGDREDLAGKMDGLFTQQGGDAVQRFRDAISSFSWTS